MTRWGELAILALIIAGDSRPALARVAGATFDTSSQGNAATSGRLTLGITLLATPVTWYHDLECPDIGPICNDRTEPEQIHLNTDFFYESRFTVAYAFDEHFGIDAQGVVVRARFLARYYHLDGEQFTPDYVPIHHQNGVKYGLGDALLRFRMSRSFGPLRVLTRIGSVIPVGTTTPDPIPLSKMGLPHQHYQFGHGVFSPVAELQLSHPAGPVLASAGLNVLLGLYESSVGYRPGNRYDVDVHGATRLPWNDLGVSLGLDLQREDKGRWHGVLVPDSGSGRIVLSMDAAVSAPVGPTKVAASISVPLMTWFDYTGVYTIYGRSQPWIFAVSAAWAYNFNRK